MFTFKFHCSLFWVIFVIVFFTFSESVVLVMSFELGHFLTVSFLNTRGQKYSHYSSCHYQLLMWMTGCHRVTVVFILI